LPPPFTTDDPIALFSAAGWSSVEVALPGQPATTYGRSLDDAKDRPFADDPTMRSYLVVARR
jgi:predicted metalloenzyme YecM